MRSEGSVDPSGFMWSVLAEAIKVATAFGTFALLTIMFSPRTYGILVGTTALLAFIVPQTSMGSALLLLQRVASNRPKQANDAIPAYRTSIGMSLAGGLAATIVLVALQGVLLPQTPRGTLALLAVSELILASVVEVTAFAAQALKNLKALAGIRALFGGTRVVAAAVLVASESSSLVVWAVGLVIAGAVSVLGSQLLFFRRPVPPSSPAKKDVREGMPFSLGFGADKVRESADQFMLLRFDLAASAGLYGAAFRITQATTAPMFALISASNARFFEQDGPTPVRDTRRLAVRLTGVGLALTIPISVAMFFWLHRVAAALFPDFEELGTALQWLSFVPPLLALEAFAASALTGIGEHTTRVRMMVVTSIVNVALNSVLIPLADWNGAVAATAAANLLYAGLVWAALGRFAEPQSTNRRVHV